MKVDLEVVTDICVEGERLEKQDIFRKYNILSTRGEIMSKGQDTKKKGSKTMPAKTMKEKKLAKREKRNEKNNPGYIKMPA